MVEDGSCWQGEHKLELGPCLFPKESCDFHLQSPSHLFRLHTFPHFRFARRGLALPRRHIQFGKKNVSWESSFCWNWVEPRTQPLTQVPTLRAGLHRQGEGWQSALRGVRLQGEEPPQHWDQRTRSRSSRSQGSPAWPSSAGPAQGCCKHVATGFVWALPAETH